MQLSWISLLSSGSGKDQADQVSLSPESRLPGSSSCKPSEGRLTCCIQAGPKPWTARLNLQFVVCQKPWCLEDFV